MSHPPRNAFTDVAMHHGSSYSEGWLVCCFSESVEPTRLPCGNQLGAAHPTQTAWMEQTQLGTVWSTAPLPFLTMARGGHTAVVYVTAAAC